jgi:hypothetical protein
LKITNGPILRPSAGDKIPLAESRFLWADKGAKNTKEKIQAVLYVAIIPNPNGGKISSLCGTDQHKMQQ